MNKGQISLLASFLDAEVEYAVVGGHAVIRHGYMRTTSDLDVFIRPTEENARAVFEALRARGVPLEGLDYTDLLDDEKNLRFGSEEDSVDILASIGEMTFDQVWRNQAPLDVDGLSIPFISKADLIENKLQVGRFIDLADVEALTAISDEK